MKVADNIKVKWQTVVDLKSNVLNMSLNCHALVRSYIKKSLDIDYEYKTAYYYDNKVAYSDEDLGNFFKLVQEKLKTEKNYFFTFPQRVYRIADSLLDHSKNLWKISNFTKKSDRELNDLFSDFIDQLSTAWPLLLIVIPIEIIVTGELDKYIRSQLEKKSLTGDYEGYFQALTQRSSKETYFQQDYRGLLKLGREIQKDKKVLHKLESLKENHFLTYIKQERTKLYKDLIRHNKDFGWLNMNIFRRHSLNLVNQLDRLKDIVQKNCDAELRNLKKKENRAERLFNKSVQELGIKGNLMKKVDLLGEYVYLRTYRMDIFSLAIFYARELLLEIASRLNVSYEELGQLTLWEINDLLLGKTEISQILLKTRMDDFAVIQIDGRFEVITDKRELKLLERERNKTGQKRVDTIKGQVASKGKAKGPARIVMHPTQVTKVQKGDVLVAPMTSPDFVIGMLKAVAIITDHGGITSHAAIVSRELGVPCVVGTKKATKVFKDGDYIEVDADKGVVTKIDR